MKPCNTLLPANPIHCYQLAPSEATFTPSSDPQSTTTSLLPAKPDCQRGESENSTATSMLPAKPDPPLTACSQRSHVHPYQRTPIHCYLLAPSNARSTATSLLPAKPDPPLPPCSQQSHSVREVRVSMSEQ